MPLASNRLQTICCRLTSFTSRQGTGCVIVLSYIDGIIIAGNDPAHIKSIKQHLSKCFNIKDLDVLEYFLRIEVARSQKENVLSQRKCPLNILSNTQVFQ